MRHFLPNLCLSLIGLLLLGYVLAGRGFAHIGVPPVYIGEVVLAASSLLFLLAPNFRVLAESRILWLIILFDLWCLAQTIPYLEEYGVDALRDSVIYGYSIFAFIVASYLIDSRSMINLLVTFDRAITLSVVLLPVILVTLMPSVTDIPDDEVPLVLLKSGDVAVHLTGAMAFRLLGLRTGVKASNHWLQWLGDALFWPAWIASFLWAIATGRAALLAIVAGVLMVALFGFARRLLFGFVTVAMLGLMTLSAFDVRIQQDRREISEAQIVSNVTSILSGGGSGGAASGRDMDLDATAEWRLIWWEEIVDYTLFGEYFWDGRGFGVNIADADGFQVGQNEEVRSPHNGHLTVLARTGVPGLMLWLAIQVAFAVSLARMAMVMKARGAFVWQGINIWILAYWTASVTNATFDVYLEGPQGGIWYWAIMGAGIAVLVVESRMVAERRTASAVRPVLPEGAP